MPSIVVEFDAILTRELKKRADKNFLSLKEMIENIVRRSMISYKGNKKKYKFKIDDRLVEAFSRDRRGRKKKKVLKK